MDKREKEIELTDYLNVLWKRKWLIIIPTFFCAMAAGVISFLLPPVWEVDAVIQVSTFITPTGEGQYNEVLLINPKNMANQINRESYNHLIAAELNLDAAELARLKGENIDTKLVRISIKTKEVEKAKRILPALVNHLKRELDNAADNEIQKIDSQVKSKEIEKLKIEEVIDVYTNKLNIIKQRKKEIEKEMSDTRKRIEELEKELRSRLNKENKSESENIAMLLYSNEILQRLRDLNTLKELLSNKKIEEEDRNFEIRKKEEEINQFEAEIVYLNESKERVTYAQLIKEPTSSLHPVSPNKKLNILIAGILSLMIFLTLAFLLEYIKMQKAAKQR